MLVMIYNLLTSLNFWSAFFGLVGTFLIFFYGFPSKINEDGHINLILEQGDEEVKKKSKVYKKYGYFGLILIALSFFLQILVTISTLE